jgi:2-polyprenyl-3-methyl-5-hydroxy-6-metoxy-1,4-benzoquinol methylase
MTIRKNYVIAIETRKNIFIAAQAIGNGTLVFFNYFCKNIKELDNMDLGKINILCCVTVLKHFFKECNIIKLNIKPRTDI